ncbi:hypothetical protein OV450_7975 [Actinobacteria bacterium OV450]|nr:hypothetical protein OV450_7975 [Actinobacteria bacterium OV450]
MTVWTLEEIETAFQRSWAADTSHPPVITGIRWTPDNPSWGHCDVTALVLNDLLGGDLVLAEVYMDGTQEGYHYWNRLESGLELGLTRGQFRQGEVVTAGQVVKRPPGRLLPRRWDEYLLLRERVMKELGHEAPVSETVGEER